MPLKRRNMKITKEKKLSLIKQQVTNDFYAAMHTNFLNDDGSPHEICKPEDWFLLGRKYYKEFAEDSEPYKLETARRCFTLAAVSGNAQFKKLLADGYLTGVFLLESKEKSEAEGLYWLERAAEENNIDAQVTMGLRYFYAKGFDKDFKEAFSWFLKAANSGNPLAARYVGEFYDTEGWGVTPDTDKALEWYKKAAEGGDSFAQCLYGKEFYIGKTVPKDYEKAFELFSASAAQNDPNGIFMKAQCVWFGLGTEKDRQKAFELFKKAADLGSPQGALDAGKALYLGEGTERDLERALVYFEQSAEGGMAEGKNAAEICRREIEA